MANTAHATLNESKYQNLSVLPSIELTSFFAALPKMRKANDATELRTSIGTCNGDQTHTRPVLLSIGVDCMEFVKRREDTGY